MPVWVQVVGAITGIIALVAALWSKVMRPGARLISSTEEMLPLMREITTVFRNSPGIFLVLKDIAEQFRSDSGSTLRDAINRIEEAANTNRVSSDSLRVGVETARMLAERDRRQLDRLLILLDRLAIRVDQISLDRVAEATRVRDREHVLDEATESVASELEAAQKRADKAGAHIPPDDYSPGAAADAYSSSPPERLADELTAEETAAAWSRLNRPTEESTGTENSSVTPTNPEKPGT